MIKILIVEDDENIAKMIMATVSIVGYEAEICDDGAAAVSRILNGNYDLVLLDVMLPGIDGFEIMERISGSEVPVIFLTALMDVADKVKGLRLGAEDYIVKPFEAVELLARIEVVLRRTKKGQDKLKYGNIEVDINGHTVMQKKQPVSLTPKEFELLVFFIQNQDIALSRERLLTAIWGYEFCGETRTVDIHVQQLRAKLGLKNNLVTLPKLGYRLNSLD